MTVVASRRVSANPKTAVAAAAKVVDPLEKVQRALAAQLNKVGQMWADLDRQINPTVIALGRVAMELMRQNKLLEKLGKENLPVDWPTLFVDNMTSLHFNVVDRKYIKPYEATIYAGVHVVVNELLKTRPNATDDELDELLDAFEGRQPNGGIVRVGRRGWHTAYTVVRNARKREAAKEVLQGAITYEMDQDKSLTEEQARSRVMEQQDNVSMFRISELAPKLEKKVKAIGTLTDDLEPRKFAITLDDGTIYQLPARLSLHLWMALKSFNPNVLPG